MRIQPLRSLLLFCVVAVLLCACLPGSRGPVPQTRYHLLRTIEAVDPQATAIADLGEAILGVGPVTLPDYLDRPQVVVHTASNELRILEFERWAEPLEQNVLRVLADNLAVLLKAPRTFTYPWPGGTQPAYRITIQVRRFDGVTGEVAVMRVRWQITADGDQRMLESREKTYSEPAAGTGTEDLVAAQSRLLLRLSRELAETIRAAAAKAG
jgi:uncharacterized lipoprotein YmbA